MGMEIDTILVMTVVRGVQLLLVLLTTALIGNVIATNVDAASSATAAVNFIMFVCIVAWVATLYGLAAHFFASIDAPIPATIMDFAATLFTFIGAIVLSAKLTSVNCSSPGDKGDDWIAQGSGDISKRCHELQASTVFLWFLLPLFAFSLFCVVKAARRGGGPSSRFSSTLPSSV